MNARLLSATVLAAAIVACGGDDKGTSTSSSGGSSTSSTSSSGEVGASGGDTDAGGSSSGATPKALAAGPKITEIMKMTGSLHVVWDLPKTCDSVELERKDGDAGSFKVAYTLPGTVDNKHDGTATGDMTYTYRARCKVGAEYTEYSNEMGKNPKQ